MTNTRRDEKLTLGQYLRKARERRQISLEEISRVTRVGIRYLEALEREAFDALPADVYVRGYLRAFARELGLDPEETMARYEAARPTASDAPVLRLSSRAASETPAGPARPLPAASEPLLLETPRPATRAARQPSPSSAGSARSPRHLSLALAIVLLLVAAVTISIIYYVNQPSDRGADPRGPTTTETATFDVTG